MPHYNEPPSYKHHKYQQHHHKQQHSEYDPCFNEDIDLENFLSYRQFENLIEPSPDEAVLKKSSSMSSHVQPMLNSAANGKFETSNIVHDILYDSELCRAGVLFTLDNDVLLSDFPLTIDILKRIIDSKSYISNINQQSIVEIVLTKCISALK
jgi:hypothetical protein